MIVENFSQKQRRVIEGLQNNIEVITQRAQRVITVLIVTWVLTVLAIGGAFYVNFSGDSSQVRRNSTRIHRIETRLNQGGVPKLKHEKNQKQKNQENHPSSKNSQGKSGGQNTGPTASVPNPTPQQPSNPTTPSPQNPGQPNPPNPGNPTGNQPGNPGTPAPTPTPSSSPTVQQGVNNTVQGVGSTVQGATNGVTQTTQGLSQTVQGVGNAAGSLLGSGG